MTYLIIAVVLCIYISMILSSKYKTAIAFIGSGLLLIIGAISSAFDVKAAFMMFPSEIIILLIVLTLFTDNFERLGLINLIGYKFLKMTKENRALIILLIPILIYATSLFMNNLTVVLLFTYMALYLAIEYKLPIVPLLVSLVIASNIGGAPLPWADTPAVILTIYTDFTLVDFLNKLFLPCLIYIGLLSAYTYLWYRKSIPQKRIMPFKDKPKVDWEGSKFPIILFLLYIVALSIGPFYDISIAYISLIFGGILLFFDRKKPIDALNDLHIMDSIAFLVGLFIIGGVLQYSGILAGISNFIMGIAQNNPYLIVISILLLAFVISTFLSAGPAAATLIPICASLTYLVPFKLIYAALAFGILAGSSMLPWSATGGPILLGQVNEFIKKPHRCTEEEKKRIRKIYSLKEYAKFSIPFSLIILICSLIYLVIVLKVVSA